MRMAITGSTGLVGSALVKAFTREGHTVARIVRGAHASESDEHIVVWQPERGEIDAAKLEGHDAVIHLAGENISSGRWNKRRKARIMESRVAGTALLSRTLAALKRPPRVLLSASAIGYYGNRPPEETVDEASEAGDAFLARVCVQWEQAAKPAEEAGIRVVHMRFGMILAPAGGAMGAMLPIFKLGLGGRIGRGEQMISWVALDELPRVIRHVMAREELRGPVNFTTPHPVSNARFTKALARALRRPAFFTVPAFAAKWALGEMAEELLLGGARVVPGKLQKSGYTFTYPHIENALQAILQNENRKNC